MEPVISSVNLDLYTESASSVNGDTESMLSPITVLTSTWRSRSGLSRMSFLPKAVPSVAAPNVYSGNRIPTAVTNEGHTLAFTRRTNKNDTPYGRH
ncbi:hypothetical protein PG987_011595 [Apiospora arundinis]